MAGRETRVFLGAIAPAKGISCHTSYWRTRGESFQLYFQWQILREESASRFYSFAKSCLDSPLREQRSSQITGWTSCSKKKMATEAGLLQSKHHCGREAQRPGWNSTDDCSWRQHLRIPCPCTLDCLYGKSAAGMSLHTGLPEANLSSASATGWLVIKLRLLSEDVSSINITWAASCCSNQDLTVPSRTSRNWRIHIWLHCDVLDM